MRAVLFFALFLSHMYWAISTNISLTYGEWFLFAVVCVFWLIAGVLNSGSNNEEAVDLTSKEDWSE